MGESIRRGIPMPSGSVFRPSLYVVREWGGGSCARGSAVGGGTHVTSGGGINPPNAVVGARWRSAYVRCVTNLPLGT